MLSSALSMMISLLGHSDARLSSQTHTAIYEYLPPMHAHLGLIDSNTLMICYHMKENHRSLHKMHHKTTRPCMNQWKHHRQTPNICFRTTSPIITLPNP